MDHANTAMLADRVEEAALNAWPAPGNVFHDGWLLRFAYGFTRRANSVNVLRAGRPPAGHRALAAKVAFCERVYAAASLPCVFRVTSLAAEPGLDAWLDRCGYRAIDETLVMLAPAAPLAVAAVPSACDRGNWLQAYQQLAAAPDVVTRLHALILGGIRLPVLHGAWPADGEPRSAVAAVGLAVHDDDVVGLFDVVTAPAHRRRGYARALVSGLIGWGARAGARHAYLQVVGNNAAAIALYESLGFRRLYSYWYRARQ